MSGQGKYSNVTGVDPNDPSLTSINCATCHDPHDPENDHQLREADTTELCGSCHGTSSRHTTYEMLTDVTTPSKHGGLECTDCHGYYLDEGEEAVNHTWTLSLPDACGQCHGAGNATRITLMEDIQADTTELLTMFESKLENVSAKVDEANETSGADMTKVANAYALIDEAEALVMFVESDESTGFHNPDLADAKLKLALAKLEEAYTEAAAAVEGKSTPGFEWFGLILAISLIGITSALFRKRRQ
jgi:predicted CXXCH cytochrome family protein